jgi:hypothetical protein
LVRRDAAGYDPAVRHARLITILIATLAAVALAVGTATAVPETAEPAPGSGFEHAVEEGEEEGRPIVFPLDLETPYGAFGAFLIICLIVGVGLGLRNAIVQLRGDRPQSDGSWRAR